MLSSVRTLRHPPGSRSASGTAPAPTHLELLQHVEVQCQHAAVSANPTAAGSSCHRSGRAAAARQLLQAALRRRKAKLQRVAAATKAAAATAGGPLLVLGRRRCCCRALLLQLGRSPDGPGGLPTGGSGRVRTLGCCCRQRLSLSGCRHLGFVFCGCCRRCCSGRGICRGGQRGGEVGEAAAAPGVATTAAIGALAQRAAMAGGGGQRLGGSIPARQWRDAQLLLPWRSGAATTADAAATPTAAASNAAPASSHLRASVGPGQGQRRDGQLRGGCRGGGCCCSCGGNASMRPGSGKRHEGRDAEVQRRRRSKRGHAQLLRVLLLLPLGASHQRCVSAAMPNGGGLCCSGGGGGHQRLLLLLLPPRGGRSGAGQRGYGQQLQRRGWRLLLLLLLRFQGAAVAAARASKLHLCRWWWCCCCC